MKTKRIAGFLPFLIASAIILIGVKARPMDHTIVEPSEIPDISRIKLPLGAKELKLDFQFPDPKKGPFLSQPEGLTHASDHRLFISDMVNNEIFVFDMLGNSQGAFGRGGQGPGELLRPASIAFSNGQVIVREAGNMRIQLFDTTGGYVAGFKIFRGYTDLMVFNGLLYTTPFLSIGIPDKGSPKMVDVLDLQGRLVNSFGDPLNTNNQDFPWLNLAHLAGSSQNELWVAFKSFPIVRKYALDGELISEFHYGFDISAVKEKYNRKCDSERVTGSTQPYYATIVHAVCGTNNGLYMIDSTAGGRFVIFRMDRDGKVGEFYWAPIAGRGFSCTGLYVREESTEKRFYVLNASEACVAVYSVR